MATPRPKASTPTFMAALPVFVDCAPVPVEVPLLLEVPEGLTVEAALNLSVPAVMVTGISVISVALRVVVIRASPPGWMSCSVHKADVVPL